jgi:hypothetical protein
MKKYLIILFIFCSAGNILQAQLYNNEWINYSNTYYKFKIGYTGLYRINAGALPAALSSVSAEQFQLWRNGQQVAIYTSVPSGPLPSTTGYIEFWGLQNDGKPDNALYKNPANQLDNAYSLETDTAAYYLTVNTASPNLRITDAANNVAGNTLPAQPYFMYDYRYDYKQQINWGLAVYYGEYLYSSTYDVGEMWSSNENPGTGISNTSGNLYVYSGAGAPTASLQFSGANNSFQNSCLVNATINGAYTAVANTNLSPFGAQIFSGTNIPLSALGSTTAVLSVTDNNVANPGRLVIGFFDLQYPRQFVFDGTGNFTFSLPASAQGNYFEVSNFLATTSPPVLYDLTNNERFTANTSTAGILKFALPPSSLNRTIVLVSEDAANITNVTTFTQPNFINFASTNQGNYLIVSNPILGFTSGGGVYNYQQYRSSTAGGGFNAQIYDINQLVDQFAFGIKKDPLSVKNFVRYARNKFAVKPQYLFMIGKGVEYDQYRYNQSSQYADLINLVPSFGAPFCSDALLASNDLNPTPALPFGRLSAVSSTEVQNYLNKIKQYEAAQQDTLPSSQTTENKLWMKNIAHIIGADDAPTNTYISGLMVNYKNIIQGPFYGGDVYTFNKLTSSQGNQGTSAFLQQLFSTGMGLLTYFGHGSSTTLDFDLNNPSEFSNPGKYPLFFVNGCNAGDVYDWDTTRLTVISNLSENYDLEAGNGGIGFLAGTNFGVTTFLDPYITGFYNSLSNAGYDGPVGNNMIAATTALLQSNNDSTTKYIEAEQYVLNGDPAFKIDASSRADFVVEQSGIFVSPSFISVNNTSFNVNVYFYNIGKDVPDSVPITVKWVLPNGSTQILLSENVRFDYEDSVSITVPINGVLDKGTNEIIASIDLPNNVVNEMTLTNNTATQTFVIYSDDITPVYPYDFAIISKSMDTVYASTANPLQPSEQYIMQMDTTTFFNSPALIQKTVTSAGGVIGFAPGIIYRDSVVYYWRVAPVPANGALYHWNNSSFVYLGGTVDGFNQSHLYQHLQSTGQNIYIDSFSRLWNFAPDSSQLTLNNTVYNGIGAQGYNSSFSVLINQLYITQSACLGHSIIFNLFDPNTLKPYYNQPQPSTTSNGPIGGFMGSDADGSCSHVGADGAQYNFEFAYNTLQSREAMVAFMNWIPAGVIVTARVIIAAPYNDGETFAPDWAKDPLVNGTNFYLTLKSDGFTDLDSYTFPRAWAFTYQKNNPAYGPRDLFTQGTSDIIALNKYITSPDSSGIITSPVFGPAAAWNSVQWNGISEDATPGDIATVDVIGVNAAGQQTLLYNLSTSQQNFNISSVSAATYPYIQLRMHNDDSIHFTPYQLRWWRLYYTPVPEGALAPNIAFSFQDTLALGQPFTPGIAFKNVSDVPFADSINVNMTVYNKSNVATVIPIRALKKIAPGDTAMISATIATQTLQGLDNFTLDVNPLTPPTIHQPEEFHFNNLLSQTFLVNSNNYNPLIDVTFNGVHILNNDIVSAKPTIEVKLKSQSPYILLNDTSMLTLTLLYPDGTEHRFQYGTDTLRFTPASGGGAQNIATADLTPYLTEDGTYELFVSGKDGSGNPAGFTQYSVQFQVINKPMITNMFNYPNPFTTSTAFVFTITGSQLPQNIRIEILTITGKIVKEITENELGPLHIGRNITQYKWNGTDMYGSKLANGVYLYRVLTNLNNQSLSKFPTYDAQGNEVNTDQYFTKGYGKMYLMR